MPDKLRIAYLTHSLRSDWNNGNAHFLRGLLRAMVALDHTVRIFEPASSWSIQNLLEEDNGRRSVELFDETFPELQVTSHPFNMSLEAWEEQLQNIQVVILHEWSEPETAQLLLTLRKKCGFALLFHDTHHRASSSPQQIVRFGIQNFDGVLAFGDVLRDIYRRSFGISRVWTLHEAADISIFKPRGGETKQQDVAWIGNWGDEERSAEIREFLLAPARRRKDLAFTIYGVRYPEAGRLALDAAGVRYEGYLPNLEAVEVYAASLLTLHIPRRQYATAMTGIPTIRVFEALACGIPLISAPWVDSEHLFRTGDMTFVQSGEQMSFEIDRLLNDPSRAQAQAAQGLETILERHTCTHRALELTDICNEVLQ